MAREAVLIKLNTLFQDVLDDDVVDLKENYSARNVPGWDSVANIRIMLSIEEEFGFKFDLGEYSEFRNVGDLVSGIIRHTS